MDPQISRRHFERHGTMRSIRLKPDGDHEWIELYMVDWSAGGARLSGETDKVRPGPALVEIDDYTREGGILLACDVVWFQDGKLGLRFLGSGRT